MTAPAARRAIGSRPLVGLVGPWVDNKGDALMLEAVRQRFPHVDIAAPAKLWDALPDDLVPVAGRPRGVDLRDRLRRGALLGAGREAAKATLLSLPPALSLGLAGRVGAHRLAGLLDCSGFGYGDQWTLPRMERRARFYAALVGQGAPVAFLPQALGPFERPDMREAARKLFATAAVIYARDADSLSHLQTLDLGEVRLRQAPDVTHLLPGRLPPDARDWRRRVAIVPNARMLDRTSPERAGAYRGFVRDAISAVRAAGLEPCLVLHGTNDRGLVEAIASAAPPAPLIVDLDAVATKGVLGACHAVIGSRYHALVSALSQATPTLGTSWSHKYDRLFDEYGHADFLVRPESPRDALGERLTQVLEGSAREDMARRLAAAAARQKERVEAMWADIEATLGTAPPAQPR